MDTFFLPLILGGIALVVLVAYLSYLAAKKRREEMQALADHLGWRFYPDKDSSHDDEYSHFEIFRKGHSRVAFNTLVGDLEIDGRRFPAKAGDVRGKGLMQTIEIVRDETAGDRTPDPGTLARLLEETKKRGLLMGKGGLHGNCIRFSPPLTVDADAVDEAIEILGESFGALDVG